MKIYDCFTFFNEIDLLKLRLAYLNDYVDKFVISECSKTQQGEDKSYNFLLHEKEFSEWKDKIIYIQADEPPELKDEADWSIENYQRNCIIRGLLRCEPDDLIILSDLDEFYDPEILLNPQNYAIKYIHKENGIKNAVKQFLKFININKKFALRFTTLDKALEITPIAVSQDAFSFYMNCRAQKYIWYGTILTKFKNMPLPQSLRDMRNALPFTKTSSGWHFSYLGGGERIKKKLQSIIEGNKLQYDSARFKTIDDYIDFCLVHGIDLWGNHKFEIIDINRIGMKNIDKIKNDFPQFFHPNA